MRSSPIPTLHGPVRMLGADQRTLAAIDPQMIAQLLQLAMGILCQLGLGDALAEELVEAAADWEITPEDGDIEPDDWIAAQIDAWIQASCAEVDVTLADTVKDALRLGRRRLHDTKLGRLIDREDERN